MLNLSSFFSTGLDNNMIATNQTGAFEILFDTYKSDSEVSNFFSGKRKITKKLLQSVLNVDLYEIYNRINKLKIKDMRKAVEGLWQLVWDDHTISNTEIRTLVENCNYSKSPTIFLGQVFLLSLKERPAEGDCSRKKEPVDIISILYPEDASFNEKLTARSSDLIKKKKEYLTAFYPDEDSLSPYIDTIKTSLTYDTSLSAPQKELFLIELTQIAQSRKNLSKILEKAFEDIKEDAPIGQTSNGWYYEFIREAEGVFDPVTQMVFSRMFSHQVNNPDSVSRGLISILARMETADLDLFRQVLRFAFTDFKGIVQLLIFVKDNQNSYQNLNFGIKTEDLKYLDNLGLLELDYGTGFAFNRSINLTYGPSKVRIRGFIDENPSRIHAGNVRLTRFGAELYQIMLDCEIPNYDQGILDFTLSTLQKYGYYIECSTYNPFSATSSTIHINEENVARCYPIQFSSSGFSIET